MPADQARGAATIDVRRGSLYLSWRVCERYFSGLDAVILLRRERDLYIMPVRNSAGGGYLLKHRNSAGDKIVNAMDFMREHGLDEFDEFSFTVTWDQKMSALKAEKAFSTAN